MANKNIEPKSLVDLNIKERLKLFDKTEIGILFFEETAYFLIGNKCIKEENRFGNSGFCIMSRREARKEIEEC